MSFYVIDIEADGPIPPKYSMVCFGAVKIVEGFPDTLYGTTKPISENWIPESLAISGISREEHLTFDDPKETMVKLRDWVLSTSVGRPIFMSDNLAFDWLWINWYFHYYLGENPFGYSGRRIGDLYCGIKKDCYMRWKHLRKTKHDHNPVNDAMGNAEVVLLMKEDLGLKIKLK